MNLKIVIAVLILVVIIGAALFFVHIPSSSTSITNSQQAVQASTNTSVAIDQIGSTLDSIASKLG